MDRTPSTRHLPADTGTQGPPSWRVLTVLAAILITHAGLAIWAASGKSVTADEILHVTQGFFANRHGDYRVQPENGILPQRVHGLAGLITSAPTPNLDKNDRWRTSSGSMIGYEFFYETGHDHFPMLMLARSLNVLFSLGTALLVFWWARRLAGAFAGLVATVLYALDPNLLAHAALATSDAAATLLLLTSVSLFWLQLEKPGPTMVLASSLVFGLACVAKFSAVLLLPMMVILIGVRIAGDRHRRWCKFIPLSLTTHALLGIVVIWMFYGFRFSGFSEDLPPADHYAAKWEDSLPYIGIQGQVVDICRKAQALPEAFVYGYAWIIQSSKARSAFLAGEYSIFGWPSFFPLAFLWKTTLAVLLGLVPAVISLTLRWRKTPALIRNDLWRTAPLLVFFGLFWTICLTSKLNIGHRHILPTYPILYVLLGAWVASLGGRRLWRVIVTGLLIGGHALACLQSAPHFLAHFNQAAGGSANGYRLLVDSSLDWGQDLPALKDWLDENNRGPAAQDVFLSYFGSGEPNYYGIRSTRLPFINGFKFIHPRYEPAAGLYCISATMLQHVYSSHRGPWTTAQEHEYQLLRRLDRQSAAATGRSLTQELWRKYDELRFARLCHYLRARPADAMAGYSILIFRVSEEELSAALDGDVSTLAEAIVRATASGQ